VANVDSFLILIGAFVIFLVVFFQSTKKKTYPTRLQMKNEVPLKPLSEAATAERAVSLNVMFNYNGHSFDAYEVLGVPAGSAWEDVRSAFESSVDKMDPSANEFYLAAFNAIKNKQQF
jgi:hypothetical protein